MSDTYWNTAMEALANRCYTAADLQRSQEVEWRQMSARVQLSGEQIAAAQNAQAGAFSQAVANQQFQTAEQWRRYMMQAFNEPYGKWKEPIDPDLELDEGL